MAKPGRLEYADSGNQRACEPFAQEMLEAVGQVTEDVIVEVKESNDGN